ncbi:hypothetical protein [Candidatus Poriferisodalis sp.]|uniref:hypothetical protein n=1 Tax=Candidatus Poriferisodalis sp. TaxID=3101277 RepID=UPI003B5A419B
MAVACRAARVLGDENYVNEIINGAHARGQRLRLLSNQNPWHESGSVPAVLAPPTERPLARVLWRRTIEDGLLRWHVILGPRRVGKTTVMYQTVARLLAAGIERYRIWWLRLGHPLLMDVALGDLVRSVTALAQCCSAAWHRCDIRVRPATSSRTWQPHRCGMCGDLW